MIFKEMLRDEREEGRAEGKIEQTAELILELLSDENNIPSELQTRIREEKNLDVLKRWHRLAAKADSLDEFITQM